MGNFTSSVPGLSGSACTQFVQDVVSSNCVVIFSKTTFPLRVEESAVHSLPPTYNSWQHRDSNLRPSVFINGQCIGGGTDTKLHQQGKLLSLIEQCRPCCLCISPEGSGSAQ
uniref:Uncharacterized protein n=2 Tax=Cyprinus carpio TaxID=7962 RepID=A0A8C1M4F4_CYPCA